MAHFQRRLECWGGLIIFSMIPSCPGLACGLYLHILSLAASLPGPPLKRGAPRVASIYVSWMWKLPWYFSVKSGTINTGNSGTEAPQDLCGNVWGGGEGEQHLTLCTRRQLDARPERQRLLGELGRLWGVQDTMTLESFARREECVFTNASYLKYDRKKHVFINLKDGCTWKIVWVINHGKGFKSA